ncbi:MAG TPA: chemotaxis protein CheX [Terracidiphilus sp.]|jgi:CheY-specific phosphatase CheX|nr:chemotaxis protein CheX [Terracidiphilus sp.]
MQIEVDESSIVKANAQFWDQMLSMHLEPMATPDQFCLSSGHVVGIVQLSGAWTGRVEIRMEEGLIYHATAAMLMQPLETVLEPDVLDAAREIANMIAGVIKSSLPRLCAMSVPESLIAREAFCGRMRDRHTVAVAFHHEAGDIMVSVLMRTCAP